MLPRYLKAVLLFFTVSLATILQIPVYDLTHSGIHTTWVDQGNGLLAYGQPYCKVCVVINEILLETNSSVGLLLKIACVMEFAN